MIPFEKFRSAWYTHASYRGNRLYVAKVDTDDKTLYFPRDTMAMIYLGVTNQTPNMKSSKIYPETLDTELYKLYKTVSPEELRKLLEILTSDDTIQQVQDMRNSLKVRKLMHCWYSFDGKYQLSDLSVGICIPTSAEYAEMANIAAQYNCELMYRPLWQLEYYYDKIFKKYEEGKQWIINYLESRNKRDT